MQISIACKINAIITRYYHRNTVTKKKQQGREISLPCCFANLFRQVIPDINCNYFFLPLYSSETVSFARPFARRAANTRRPFLVAILSRKPCLFFLFLLEGWNVLFIVLYIICFCSKKCFMLFSVQNYSFFL